MNRPLFIAALTGFVIVALGAFGAHGLDGQLPDKAKGWWATASQYGLAHSVAALALALSGGRGRAALIMCLGVFLFSGSLYAMALGAPSWFGAITPLGGVAFLAGWALAAWSARTAQ